MRAKELPGLAGQLVADYFCQHPARINEGLAVGGALDALRWALGNRCRVQPPSLTPLWTDNDIPKNITWAPTILVGPGGANVVEATEALLALADDKPPTPQPWPQWGPLQERTRCCLGAWNEPFLSPLYHSDYFLLVPADGHIARGAGANTASIVARLRTIAASTTEFVVRMDTLATDAYRGMGWTPSFGPFSRIRSLRPGRRGCALLPLLAHSAVVVTDSQAYGLARPYGKSCR